MSRILPILFNTKMVRLTLDERMTVTRRVVKPQQLIGLGCDKCPNNQPEEYIKEKKMLFKPWCDMDDNELISAVYKPPYQTGDILYVRETFVYDRDKGEGEFLYKASPETYDHIGTWDDIIWHPSIHMPREAARIWLKVTDVRVERLQDITEEQAVKEGIKGYWAKPHENDVPFIGAEGELCFTRREAFSQIWNSTLKKSDLDRYGWDANPWVWVIEFERCEKPETLDWRKE